MLFKFNRKSVYFLFKFKTVFIYLKVCKVKKLIFSKTLTLQEHRDLLDAGQSCTTHSLVKRVLASYSKTIFDKKIWVGNLFGPKKYGSEIFWGK